MTQFDDIRPYCDDEVRPTVERLLGDDEFIDIIIRFLCPKLPRYLSGFCRPIIRYFLDRKLRNVQTVNDLQRYIESYIRRMLNETTLGLTISGEENLTRERAHLFISNHRDIVADPAVVNWTLLQRGHKTLHVAVGDNLLTKPCVSDLMRLNKSFIVNRSAKGSREKFKAAKHLSSYVHHAITKEQSNIWIAQREGRAKDGIDRTNSAVISMLALHKPKSLPLTDCIHELNIVPVSISYERDPCDILKAKELYIQGSEGRYQKAEYEDVASIAQGITGFKGRVHVAFGAPLDGEYQTVGGVVAELDQKIIHNYVLQPSNCVAYEKLHGELPEGVVVTADQVPFLEADFAMECQQFNDHVCQCDEAYRNILLSMYANPIVSQYS
ncbi:MAG: 1-acyl-sn-glycerol-3-phosphate acyltransferase [Cellvibrionaceae bacterium]|jgi:1-acyl-sn-glycerol-3-phosphate acyltransferase